jgi:hypothetical protein
MVDANRWQLVRHIASVHCSAYRSCASFLLGTVQGSAIRNYDGTRWDFGEVFSFPGAWKLRDANTSFECERGAMVVRSKQVVVDRIGVLNVNEVGKGLIF